MRVVHGFFKSPLGVITIICSDNALLRLILPGGVIDCNIGKKSINHPFILRVYKQLEEYFLGIRRLFTFNYKFINVSDFRKKVYDSLLEIPYAKVVSYQDIAISIGNDNASRAVGLANKNNPLPIVVPCHRVMGKGMKSRGFTPCVSIQEKLLEHEYKSNMCFV